MNMSIGDGMKIGLGIILAFVAIILFLMTITIVLLRFNIIYLIVAVLSSLATLAGVFAFKIFKK